ncbi:unnamed protein product [Gordionus sp. m RMFG-2023]
MNINLNASKEFLDMILKFNLAVNTQQPKNLIAFAASYFTELAKEDRSRHSSTGSSNLLGANLNLPDVSKSPSPSPEPPRNRLLRRQSISLEKYDMDNLDDIEVVPKTKEQKAYLIKIIQNIILFRALDKEQANVVVDAMKERRVLQSEKILEQGEIVENFFIIERGIFESSIHMEENSRRVCVYENNGSFGEIALLYNQPSAYTIIARSEGILWVLDRNTYKKVVAESAIRKQNLYEDFINRVPLLKSLTEHEKMNLVCAFKPEYFEDGATIIKHGEKNEKIYFIERGNVDIITQPDTKDKKISKMGVGDYFGGNLFLSLFNPLNKRCEEEIRMDGKLLLTQG